MQSQYSSGSIQCKKCGVLCRNPLQYKNHVRNVHQELDQVESNKEKFGLPPKWRTKRVGAIDLFISPSGELFETVEQVLAEESRRNTLKTVEGGNMNADEKEIVSSYTTLRSRNWYDGIEFRCDLCKKASFHHDFIYKQRYCTGFDKEKAILACKETLYQCKICFKEVIHTRKHIKNHLNNHNIDLEEYKIKYVIDKLVTKESDNDTKKNVTPEEIADKFNLVKAKLENIKLQKKSLLGTKADLIVDIELEQRWCDGYTFNCDMCSKDFYSFKSTSAHMTKSHPFAKEALEKENSELFSDPTKSGSFFYECKICHNKNIKHDERYIEEHTTSFHKMPLRQYGSIYEANKNENSGKPKKELEDVSINSNDVLNIVNSNQNGKYTQKITPKVAQVSSNVIPKRVNGNERIIPFNREDAQTNLDKGLDIIKPKKNKDKIALEKVLQRLNAAVNNVNNLRIEETWKNEKIKSSKDNLNNDIIMEPKGNRNNKETLPLLDVPPNSIDIGTNVKLEELGENEKINMTGSLEETQVNSSGIVSNVNITEPVENKKNKGTMPPSSTDLFNNVEAEEPKDNEKIKIAELLEEAQGTLALIRALPNSVDIDNNVKLEETGEYEKIKQTGSLEDVHLSSNSAINNVQFMETDKKEENRGILPLIDAPFSSNDDIVNAPKENKKKDPINNTINPEDTKENGRKLDEAQLSSDYNVSNGNIEEPKENDEIKKEKPFEETQLSSNGKKSKKLRRKRKIEKIQDCSNVLRGTSMETEETEGALPTTVDTTYNVNNVMFEEPKENEKIELKESLAEDEPRSKVIVNNDNMAKLKDNELNEKFDLENSSSSTDNRNAKEKEKNETEEEQPNSNGINFVEHKENDNIRNKRSLEDSQQSSNHNDNSENTSNMESNPKKAKICKPNTNEADIYNPPMQSRDPMQYPSPPKDTQEPRSDKIDEETDHSDISEKCATNQEDAKSPSLDGLRPLPVRYNWNNPWPSSPEDGERSVKKLGKLEEAKVSCPLNNCLFITTEEHVQSGRAGLHLLFTHGVEQEDNLSNLLGKFTKL